MAAGEDQAQPLIQDARGDRLLHGGLVLRRRREGRYLGGASTQRALSAQPVDRAVARDGEDLRRRIAWHAVERPALDRGGERALDRLFGEVPVAD
jgi:hypothetical protein